MTRLLAVLTFAVLLAAAPAYAGIFTTTILDDVDTSSAVVPEPTAALLFGAGLAAVAFAKRRR